MTHKTYPKEAPVRSESYRRWVASLPCAGCGVEGYSQAAHPNRGKGMAIKASDLLCFPLCCDRPGVVGCHTAHDQRRRGASLSLAEWRDWEQRMTAYTQAAARRQGRKELG